MIGHVSPRAFWAALLVWTLIVCLATPAWASGAVYSVVVKGTSAEHEIEAYQIFGGSVSTTNALSFKLDRPSWGSGISAEGQKALGDAAEVYAGIQDSSAFAQMLVDQGWLVPEAATKGAYNSDTACYVVHHLEPGYYLIKDGSGTNSEQPGFAYIPYLTTVAGNVDVDAQAEAPRLIKQFYTDAHAVGRPDLTAAPGTGLTAKLTATLPQNFSTYEAYALEFSDTVSPGLVLDPASIKVQLGTVLLDEGTYTVDYASNGTLSIRIPSVQEQPGAAAGAALTVSYALTCGDANETIPTTATLTYSNNPNPGGASSYGVTAPVQASVTVQAAEPAQASPSSNQTAHPRGRAVALGGACVLAIAVVVGVITRKHEA